MHAGYLRLQTHTLRLRNTYCFSTATMVARTHLNVMLYVHCLSRSSYQRIETINLPLQTINEVKETTAHHLRAALYRRKRKIRNGVGQRPKDFGLRRS